MPDSLIGAWRAMGYGLSVPLWIFVLPQLFSRVLANRFDFKKLNSIELSFLVLITVLGLGLRFLFIEEFQAGQLTSDEAFMSIYYTSGIVGGESVRTGATKIVFAAVLDLWHQFFPFTPFWSRCLSGVIGLLGVIFLFFGVARCMGTRVAAWTAALLAISLYGIYWSKLSLELSWTLFIPPLVLCLISFGRGPLHGFVAFFSGFFIAAGLFTYPGTILVFVALTVGAVLGWITDNVVLHPLSWRGSLPRRFDRSFLYFCAGFSSVLALGAYLHFTVYGIHSQPLFFGGGQPTLGLDAASSNLKFILADLFVQGRSWYLPYRHAAFVEPFVWPFVVLGVRVFWACYPNWKGRALIYAMPILLLLAALTGPYPGMRRAVGLLPFLYFFCALGIVSFLDAFSGTRGSSGATPLLEGLNRRCVAKGTIVGLLALAIAHALFYQFTYGRRVTRFNFGTGFGVDAVDYDDLMELLRQRQVVMGLPNQRVYFDKLLYRNYPVLAGRYDPGLRTENRVHFLNDTADPFVRDLEQRRDWVLIAWDASKLLQYLEDLGLCVLLDERKSHRSIPFLAYSRPFPTSGPGAACKPADEIARSVDNSVLLGYRHQEERIRHRVRCEGPYCDSSRPDFLYSRDGDVTFVLRVPEPESVGGWYELRIYVRYAQPDRQSRIFVDERFVGALDIAALNSYGLARYRLPTHTYQAGDVVHVAIRPAENPRMLGWDVERSAVVWVADADEMPKSRFSRGESAP